MAQQRWDKDFAGAIDSPLRRAQSGGPARASPIITSLRAVAADPDFDTEIPSPDHTERQSVALAEFYPAFFDASDVQTVSFDPAP